MAKARMLHHKISISMEVNSMPLPAQLLFTWMISHADDDGKLKGNPRYIKATVVPLMNWPVKKIQVYLELMKVLGLIHLWKVNDEWYIEFPKWKSYQTIKIDRYKASDLPSYLPKDGSHSDPSRIQTGSKVEPQDNRVELNIKETKKSEYKQTNTIADKQKTQNVENILDPNRYLPSNANELAAKDTWLKLEPNNKAAFYTTYLPAARRGLLAAYFYLYTSEIKQSRAVNPGAVFNTKVKEYFAHKEYAI